MYQLAGEYRCTIDAKGRIRMPSSLIGQLGTGAIPFTLNRGFEKNLMLYPKIVWEKKTKEINQLNIYNTKQRQAIRYFYRGATVITPDSNERILVPKSLMEYAGLKKQIVLFAYHEQVEIWSSDAYEQVLNLEPEDFSEFADEVFGANPLSGEQGAG